MELFWTYFIGFIASILVYRKRAGIGQSVSFEGSSLALIMSNITWFVTTILKAFGWPIVMVLWVAKGRPSSPWAISGFKEDIPLIRRLQPEADEESN